MAEIHRELILSFCDVTNTNAANAQFYLESSNWDLNSALSQFYEEGALDADDNDDEDNSVLDADDNDDELYATPAPLAPPVSSALPASSSSAARSSKSKSKSKLKSGSGPRVRTLGDLSSGAVSDDEDEPKQDLFAGGEKSGLAVQDPGDGAPGGRNLIQDILKRAAEGGQAGRQQDENEIAPPSRFSGSGHTLGSESAESITIPDPRADRPAPRPSVTRTLTFWRDGFSVEDGPLMRYDDPANREILQAIENGRAPLSLMNVEPGQPADVNVFKRLEEDYVPPKKKFVPFSGEGQRLGSVTPGESSVPAAPPPTPTAPPNVGPSNSVPTINVDSSVPVATLQVRLGDGTRLISQFNHTHTVGDLYAFVDASRPEARNRNYVLQTTFPTHELKDKSHTIKEAGLINAVVVQKWAS